MELWTALNAHAYSHARLAVEKDLIDVFGLYGRPVHARVSASLTMERTSEPNVIAYVIGIVVERLIKVSDTSLNGQVSCRLLISAPVQGHSSPRAVARPEAFSLVCTEPTGLSSIQPALVSEPARSMRLRS